MQTLVCTFWRVEGLTGAPSAEVVCTCPSKHSVALILTWPTHNSLEGVHGGHRGDRLAPPDESRATRLRGGAVGHSHRWHAASHLPGGVYAGRSTICWLLQGSGPDLDSHTEERLLCAAVKSGPDPCRSRPAPVLGAQLSSGSHLGRERPEIPRGCATAT